MSKQNDKTNVMRILDSKRIEYTPYEYSPDLTEGVLIAEILGEPVERVYKTLVTESASGSFYVFVIPVEKTLDLKAAAKTVGEKSISMLKQKNLLQLTGYIHGGCSPIGMKKQFKTVIDESALGFDKIFVSAGRCGKQIEVSPRDISELIAAKFASITVCLHNI